MDKSVARNSSVMIALASQEWVPNPRYAYVANLTVTFAHYSLLRVLDLFDIVLLSRCHNMTIGVNAGK